MGIAIDPTIVYDGLNTYRLQCLSDNSCYHRLESYSNTRGLYLQGLRHPLPPPPPQGDNTDPVSSCAMEQTDLFAPHR